MIGGLLEHAGWGEHPERLQKFPLHSTAACSKPPEDFGQQLASAGFHENICPDFVYSSVFDLLACHRANVPIELFVRLPRANQDTIREVGL